MSIQDFIKKWGTEGWFLILGEFILRSPDFDGDFELAQTLGEIAGDLQTALIHESKNRGAL